MPSVISRRVIHRLRTRRLRTAVAITAKRNALEYAVITRRTVSVVTHRTAITRSAIVSAAAAATAMARSATRTTAGVVLTSARIARNDITASVTAHTLITAVPVTASLDCIHRISRSIYAVRITVSSINTRITKVAHSIFISFCVFERTLILYDMFVRVKW